jgi:hypothetical protein
MESFNFGTLALSLSEGCGAARDGWSLPKTNARDTVKKEKSGRIVANDRVRGVPMR